MADSGHASRLVRRETGLFRAATAVGLLHVVDEALVHRHQGVPLSQHAVAVVVTLVIGITAGIAFPRLSPGPRAGVSAFLGILAAVNGALHVIGVVQTGFTAGDVSGVAAALSGVVLIGLACAILLVHRRSNPRRGARRWIVRGAAAAATIAAMPVVVMPIGVAIGETHTIREPIDARPGPSYDDVTFRTTDGVRLSGWYSPSRNGAAVVLVNSTRGDRNGSIEHARLIASHGYGVLLYDARGTGRSGGDPNGYGWSWHDDIVAAVSFLHAQHHVCRIGALGLSTGADALLALGGQDRRIGAVVTDGATARSTADLPASGLVTATSFRVLFGAVSFFSGQGEPRRPLRSLVADISPTPLLLIAAGSIPQERPANIAYARAAGEPVELWDLPHVDHTAAIRQVADEYESRVIGFFDQALLPAEC